MTVERKTMDELVSRRHAVEKVAGDLGLVQRGAHFYCPGCQPRQQGTPEMVIKDGQFRCFRCDAAGDVVGLVKLARGCDLDAAIAWLERETGEASPQA
jgi:CHC2 zinc finger